MVAEGGGGGGVGEGGVSVSLCPPPYKGVKISQLSGAISLFFLELGKLP